MSEPTCAPRSRARSPIADGAPGSPLDAAAVPSHDTGGPMVPLPEGFLNALAGRD